MIDRPSTRIPPCTATMTSGTVRHPHDVGADRRAAIDTRRASRGSVPSRRRTRLRAARFPAPRRPRAPARAAPASYGADMSGNRGPEPVVVRADERVVAEQVDVVGDQHQVARRPERIHPAAGVRHDERLRAERAQHAHRKGHLLQRVALVAVKAALHRDDRLSAERAAQQPAGVRSPPSRAETRECRAYSIVASTSISRASPPSPVPRMIADVGRRARSARARRRRRVRSSRADAARCVRGRAATAPHRSFLARRDPRRHARVADAVAPPAAPAPRRRCLLRGRDLGQLPLDHHAELREIVRAARARAPRAASCSCGSRARALLDDASRASARASRRMSCASRSACSRISPRSCCARDERVVDRLVALAKGAQLLVEALRLRVELLRLTRVSRSSSSATCSRNCSTRSGS